MLDFAQICKYTEGEKGWCFMLHEERHNHILSELAEKGAVKVAALAKVLNTSESTIRRGCQTEVGKP